MFICLWFTHLVPHPMFQHPCLPTTDFPNMQIKHDLLEEIHSLFFSEKICYCLEYLSDVNELYIQPVQCNLFLPK